MSPVRRARSAGAMLLAAAAILLMLFTGCGSSEIQPSAIVKDELCARCKSMIAEKQYAAQFVTKDGFVRKFDDISCMVQHVERVNRKNISAFFAMDYASQSWVKGEEASYVRSDKFQTPRNGGILAFKDRNQARALSTQYHAELLTFADIIK
jgi:copper chaperone NosL